MKKADDAPATAGSSPPEPGPLKIEVDGKRREFDIDAPELPDWIEQHRLSAGGYPYDRKMKRKEYERTLEELQIELVKAQGWLQAKGARVLALFERPFAT